ncbi:D-cysteine desulfhydrase [Marchantia polymorpha subsp. ruderalis]|uniref:Tryptophan synthase beta chain-like PALP domain-containing protein n=2 Tax=Marchantia polymorpha TaxID=3197 RepID=A0AAF6B5P7_MARPO|nr:hypothetical protein MARPO_0080s0004 [Marchantia polymorpha]BBN07331.1 hypothetical protein Mp_4g02950 [Marchantia polymorpha subsp. ruderalis]|eukprot:PTQ34373.1 hypothetical protein MARPO_0080s0004 [Marchantia polymorpha]
MAVSPSSFHPLVSIVAGPPRSLSFPRTHNLFYKTPGSNRPPPHISAGSSEFSRQVFKKLGREIEAESGLKSCPSPNKSPRNPVSLVERAVRRLTVRAATSSMELSTKTGGEVEHDGKRPPMFKEESYSPPSWAAHLHPIPPSFFSLGLFPTPIHRWDLPGLAPGTELWVKRDDLTGMQLSGNKVRKLEFLMSDAKAKGADCVITIGGVQSNHCRATAVAARYCGLDSYLILRTSRTVVDEDPGLAGNLLVERLVGAHIDLVTKEEYVQYGSKALGDMLLKRLRAEGRKPYLIPVGGSNTLGSWGYIEGVREIETQLRQGNADGATHFDDIVMACGSGGTTAGLALGSHLSTLKSKVHGYGVCDDEKYFYDYIQDLLDGFNAGVISKEILEVKMSKGAGYAISSPEELKIVKDVAEQTGLILDPVYSGKAVNGFLKDMKENPSYWQGRKVLFVHTGGLLGMYDKVDQLQPMVAKSRRMLMEG